MYQKLIAIALLGMIQPLDAATKIRYQGYTKRELCPRSLTTQARSRVVFLFWGPDDGNLADDRQL